MTFAQIERRVSAIEKMIDAMRDEIEHQHALDGIRGGLESADRGEGESLDRTFVRIRRKYQRKPSR